jgi:hypothetical protein
VLELRETFAELGDGVISAMIEVIVFVAQTTKVVLGMFAVLASTIKVPAR